MIAASKGHYFIFCAHIFQLLCFKAMTAMALF